MKTLLFITLASLASLASLAPLAAETRDNSPKAIFTETQSRLQNTTLYFRGARVFDQMCTQCHGRSGRGNGPWAETMDNKPRNFRLGVFKFRTTPCGKLPSDADLRRTIRHGISGTAMPTFAKMSESDLNGVIVFIQSLSPRWKDPENFATPIETPTPPAWLADPAKSADHVKAGQTQFALSCASCHGPTGEGNGPASKGLLDIRGLSISPASFSAEHLKSGDTPADLYRTISLGLDGTPMPGHQATLKPDQIWNLVAYISTLRKTE
ncbi:MAG: c-type cytochrome [Verrucomicrobiaceae bacterium]